MERKTTPTFGTLMSRDQADAIWDVLVREAHAREDRRDEFVHSVTYHGLDEYRFGGSLGSGGKVRWSRRKGFYVDSYREDLTPERTATIDRTNAALALFATTEGEES